MRDEAEVYWGRISQGLGTGAENAALGGRCHETDVRAGQGNREPTDRKLERPLASVKEVEEVEQLALQREPRGSRGQSHSRWSMWREGSAPKCFSAKSCWLALSCPAATITSC